MSSELDSPTTAELLESVREFLEADVVPQTRGRLSFHARVAANVLTMVERELALGSSLLEARRERLDALGTSSESELAAAIRSGDLDDRWDEVLAAVRATVDDRLRVANPGYLDE